MTGKIVPLAFQFMPNLPSRSNLKYGILTKLVMQRIIELAGDRKLKTTVYALCVQRHQLEVIGAHPISIWTMLKVHKLFLSHDFFSVLLLYEWD